MSSFQRTIILVPLSSSKVILVGPEFETSVKLIDKFSVNMAMYCVSDIQVSYSEIPLTTNQAILNLTVNSFRKAMGWK